MELIHISVPHEGKVYNVECQVHNAIRPWLTTIGPLPPELEGAVEVVMVPMPFLFNAEIVQEAKDAAKAFVEKYKKDDE